MPHEVRVYRNLVEFNDLEKPNVRASKNRKEGKPRAQIGGFSDRSKVRLHRLLERVSRPETPIFATLTYQRLQEDSRESKKHLDVFIKRLRRVDPALSGVWRLEYQRRGAMHYHLVLWASSPEAENQLLDARWIGDAWCAASDQHSREALQHAASVERSRDAATVFRYLVGHHVKQDQVRDDLHTGRYWGVIGREHMVGLEGLARITLSDAQSRVFRRLLVRYKSRASCRGKRPSQRTLDLIERGDVSSVFIPAHDQMRLVRCARAIAPDDPF